MTRFLLIRHGESEANREGYFAGQSDALLLDRGLVQAELTADFIAESYKVDKIFASDLRRSYDTALAVARRVGLPVETDARLREIYSGKWQGKRFEDITSEFCDSYGVWLHDIGRAVCDGGESVRELGERVCDALLDIARLCDGETVVVATHATPIRAVQCKVATGGFEGMKDIPWVSNASVTELIFDGGEWTLGRIGQDKHLSDLKTVFGANV